MSVRNRDCLVAETARSEQFRPAILAGLSDHDVRDEHVFSLFQVF